MKAAARICLFLTARPLSKSTPSLFVDHVAAALTHHVARIYGGMRLLRAFRQSMGMPPHRWLLKRRVERAQELLQLPLVHGADDADIR